MDDNIVSQALETAGDKKMSNADLRKKAGVAPNTMTRLRRDEGYHAFYSWMQAILMK